MLPIRISRNFPVGNRMPLNRFFDDNLSRFFEGWDLDVPTRGWNPPADIHEEGDKIVMAVELPGFKEKEISVNVDNGRLTVTGERIFEKSEDRDYQRVERYYGKFQRSFQLPTTVDAGKIGAALENGVLTLTATKRDEAKPRQIKVKS